MGLGIYICEIYIYVCMYKWKISMFISIKIYNQHGVLTMSWIIFFYEIPPLSPFLLVQCFGFFFFFLQNLFNFCNKNTFYNESISFCKIHHWQIHETSSLLPTTSHLLPNISYPIKILNKKCELVKIIIMLIIVFRSGT